MPIDFTLTDEQQAYRDALRDTFAREVGSAEQRERLTEGHTVHHSPELAAKLGASGLLGPSIAEEHGGGGAGVVEEMILLEEQMRALAPIGAYPVSLIVAGAVQKFGTPEQKELVLGNIAAGGVEAIAMSEPEAGSDVAALSTTAKRVDGGWVLNGVKVWISNAHIADRILIVCRDAEVDADPATKKHEGLCMIWVDPKAQGVRVDGIETIGGYREVNYVYLDDVFAPDDALLGQAGAGWMQLMAGLNTERLIIAALALGQAEQALGEALQYAKDRKQFGRSIGSFQVQQHRLVDMATEVELARLLVYKVAADVDRDPTALFPREASMAKVYATETAERVVNRAFKIHGGYGYAKEYAISGQLAHSLVATTFGGTNDIQRNIIAKVMGL
ncbi:acyl-CoA dehydrogenase family protein [Patulibacter americanus]|uniref:acyl-CoA dehydrogenase family protein n=1 Tax=Patulibacter americanus TaxID=588672 RepID=UPI0003B5D430|nr:acyl-CoA dehydrogenase family protein [Patulibacter americanus]